MATLEVGTNSYASLVDADAYFDASLRALTWAGLDEDTRIRGLIEATRLLERLIYKGTKEVSTQTLAFPRTGVTDCSGTSLTPTQTLTIISQAEFEYAFALIQDPTLLDRTTANAAANTKRLKAGSAEIEYFRPGVSGRYPVQVMETLKCLTVTSGTGGGVIGNGALASGTGDETSFEDDNYGLTQGYY